MKEENVPEKVRIRKEHSGQSVDTKVRGDRGRGQPRKGKSR